MMMDDACEMLTDRTGEFTLEAIVGFYLRKVGLLEVLINRTCNC